MTPESTRLERLSPLDGLSEWLRKGHLPLAFAVDWPNERIVQAWRAATRDERAWFVAEHFGLMSTRTSKWSKPPTFELLQKAARQHEEQRSSRWNPVGACHVLMKAERDIPIGRAVYVVDDVTVTDDPSESPWTPAQIIGCVVSSRHHGLVTVLLTSL